MLQTLQNNTTVCAQQMLGNYGNQLKKPYITIYIQLCKATLKVISDGHPHLCLHTTTNTRILLLLMLSTKRYKFTTATTSIGM